MKQAVKILSILLALGMNALEAKIILCDLGGTFVDVNQRTYAIQELGIPNILLNGLTNNLQFNPKQKMFAALDKIAPRNAQEQAEVITHDTVASNSQGKQPDGLGGLKDSGFRFKNTAGMTTPANVKLWEPTGRAGGLP